MKTNDILLAYLQRSGVKVKMGRLESEKVQTEEERINNYNLLVLDLKANSAFKNKLIIVIYVLLSVFFVFCLYLFYLVKDDKDKIAYLFGGTVFSILAVITPMIRIWRDKERTDTFLKVLPLLKEDDRLSAVLGFLKLSESNNKMTTKTQVAVDV
jgi:hypothetical protein